MSKSWLPVLVLAACVAFASQPAASQAADAGLSSPAPDTGQLVHPNAIRPSFVCVEDAFTMCLNGGRFEVFARFDTNTGLSGDARTVRLTDDSGYMWFFKSTNIEAVVKVLNGCALNNEYWFFAGGLTNVHVLITLTDSITGVGVTYENRRNTPFLPIQDTAALHVCP